MGEASAFGSGHDPGVLGSSAHRTSGSLLCGGGAPSAAALPAVCSPSLSLYLAVKIREGAPFLSSYPPVIPPESGGPPGPDPGGGGLIRKPPRVFVEKIVMVTDGVLDRQLPEATGLVLQPEIQQGDSADKTAAVGAAAGGAR